MSDKNFDSLKNLKAPDKWIKNALDIPNTRVVKPSFFLRYSRSVAAIACLVLVCTMSIIAVLHKDKNDILVIAPDSNITQTEESTNKADCSDDATEKSSVPDNKDNQKATSTNNGGAPVESTETNDNPTHSNNEKPQKPTNKPDTESQPQTDATASPTNATEIMPSAPVEPTAKPTESPTDDMTDEPVISPPTSKPDFSAISNYRDVHDYCEVVDYIETRLLTGSKKVYCVVKNVDKPYSPWLNGENLFTPDHLCTVWQEMNGYTYFAYSISNNYNIEEDGTYLYVIYNEDGAAFFTNRVYVYANQ